MAYLHCRIRILIPIRIRTVNQMTALHYAEVFTMHGVKFKFQSYCHLKEWNRDRDQNRNLWKCQKCPWNMWDFNTQTSLWISECRYFRTSSSMKCPWNMWDFNTQTSLWISECRYFRTSSSVMFSPILVMTSFISAVFRKPSPFVSNMLHLKLNEVFWWLIELSYIFKANYSLKIMGIFTTRDAKDNYRRWNSAHARWDWTPNLENLHIVGSRAWGGGGWRG